jgi:hypothetical protein
MAEYISNSAPVEGDNAFHTAAPRKGSFGDFAGNVKSADTKNTDTDLNVSASSENLSAKYKYPGVSQTPEPKP